MEGLPMPAPFGFPHDLQQQQHNQHNISTYWLVHTRYHSNPTTAVASCRVLMPLQLFAAG
jgi:hypothetical protein